MTRKLTREEFIRRAREVHGDKYDYSQSIYVDAKTPLLIKCNTCGTVFPQVPFSHFAGRGCDKCARRLPKMGARKNLFGVGKFDIDATRTSSKTIRNAYFVWYDMLCRCYSKKFQEKQPSYIGCVVCEEWKLFSNFLAWFEVNYKEGCELDKDILFKNNKVYSPETCIFLPKRINTLILRQKRKRGEYPIGVHNNGSSFIANIKKDKKTLYLGSFKTKEEAFLAHKQAKELYIQEVAQEYFNKGEIDKRVYDALMNYKIEIID